MYNGLIIMVVTRYALSSVGVIGPGGLLDEREGAGEGLSPPIPNHPSKNPIFLPRLCGRACVGLGATTSTLPLSTTNTFESSLDRGLPRSSYPSASTSLTPTIGSGTASVVSVEERGDGALASLGVCLTSSTVRRTP